MTNLYSAERMPRGESNALEEPISVPDSGDYSKRGKGKMISDLLKRCVGVEDLAAARVSLPACLVEPVPNLEYWCYLDRPDLFVAINDSDDPLQRMLSVVRFCFSKDLKLAKGEPLKPYDSFPGEYFRAYIDVPTDALSLASRDSSEAPTFSWHLDEASTGQSSAPRNYPVRISPNSPRDNPAPPIESEPHRVVFLKEQISDDPSMSAYWFECLNKGVEASGVDHISASTNGFGSIIEVRPGSKNNGIFVRIKKGPGSGESYRITHPRGIVKGFISGYTHVMITDSTTITCSGGLGKQLRTIIEYKDQPSNAPNFEVEGIIFFYEGSPEHETWTKVLQVPKELVMATFEGCWKGAITWKRPGSYGRTSPLIDLSQLAVVPKQVRRVRTQLPNESRRFWDLVTTDILKRNFLEATRAKRVIEQEQETLSRTREKFGIRFDACYFESDISSGAPILTSAGRRVLMDEKHSVHDSPADSTPEYSSEEPHESILTKPRAPELGPSGSELLVPALALPPSPAANEGLLGSRSAAETPYSKEPHEPEVNETHAHIQLDPSGDNSFVHASPWILPTNWWMGRKWTKTSQKRALESPIKEPHEQNLTNRISELNERMKGAFNHQERKPKQEQNVSVDTNRKPRSRRKKQEGSGIRRRGSSSGSGELAHTVSRSSGSGELGYGGSRSGSRSSVGDHISLRGPSKHSPRESLSKYSPTTPPISTEPRGRGGAGLWDGPRTDQRVASAIASTSNQGISHSNSISYLPDASASLRGRPLGHALPPPRFQRKHRLPRPRSTSPAAAASASFESLPDFSLEEPRHLGRGGARRLGAVEEPQLGKYSIRGSGIPPILPRPPSHRKERLITDEELAVYQALNTYR